MSDWKLIELYSNMPTNKVVNCALAGDLIKLPSKDAIKLIDILMDNQVEFTVHEVGECLMDKSYEYWVEPAVLEVGGK